MTDLWSIFPWAQITSILAGRPPEEECLFNGLRAIFIPSQAPLFWHWRETGLVSLLLKTCPSFLPPKMPATLGQTEGQSLMRDAATWRKQECQGLCVVYWVTVVLQENTGTVIMVMNNVEILCSTFLVIFFSSSFFLHWVSFTCISVPILSRGHLHLPHSRPIVRVLRRLDLDQRPEIAHFCADLLVVGGHLPLGARRGSFFMATQRLPTLRYPGIFICTGIRRISSIPCVTGRLGQTV